MDSCLLISCILKMSRGGSIFPSSSQPPFYLNVRRATQGWNLNFQALKRIENKLLYMLYTPVYIWKIQYTGSKRRNTGGKGRNTKFK
uniref:Putative ovule protein n=1 Tax=Solanum chacoense TaxID=4108 RepID=A0A0V0IIE1_SOLCH